MSRKALLNLGFWLFAASIPGVFCIALFYLFTFSYSEFIGMISVMLSRENWKDFFQEAFPEPAFKVLRILISCLCFASFFLLWYLLRKKKRIIASLDYFSLSLKTHIVFSRSAFGKQTAAEKIFIFSLLLYLLVASSYHIATLPLQYDEMWSYNYFVNGAFWKTFLLPRNHHILYTVSAWFFDLLPFDQDILIRVPALFAGLFFCISFWMFARRLFSTNVAMIVTAFISSGAMVTTYLVIARSYSMLLLIYLFMLWVAVKLMKYPRDKFYRQFYFLILLLGYIANPLFLFGHCAQLISTALTGLKQKNFSPFTFMIKASVFAAALMALFYLPQLLTIRESVLRDNQIFQEPGENFSLVKETLGALALHQTGFLSAVYFYPLFLAIPLLITRKKNPELLFINLTGVVAILLVIVCVITQRRLFPERFFIFITIPTAFILGILCSQIRALNFLTTKTIFVLLIIIFCINSFLTYSRSNFFLSKTPDQECRAISEILILHQLDSCYIQIPYFKPGLEYYQRKAGGHLETAMSEERSLDYRPETDYDKYPAVIAFKNAVLPGLSEKYQLAFKATEADLWIRKGR